MAAARPTGLVTLAHVKKEVRLALTRASDRPELRRFLERLLSKPGRVLAADGRAPWPGFVLQTCAALGGDLRVAPLTAAAVELAVTAIDVVDDLIDGDFEGTANERARAQNASLVLGWLSQRCVIQLADHIGLARAARLGDVIAAWSLSSCDGQDLDLLLEGDAEADEHAALDATIRKSGSLCAMACLAGAALATDDPATLDVVRRFGQHAGVTAQLLNDLEGVSIDASLHKNDFRQRKKTVPAAYLLHCAREDGLDSVLDWYASEASLDHGHLVELATAAHVLGALTYTWILADVHRREALRALDELRQLTGRDAVLSLRRLVPSVRARSLRAAA